MRVLIACEESQAVTKAFRALGHEAYSCDLLPCSGGHPEWHFQQSVFEVIDKGWDLMIAHPPCTFLSVSGARHLYNKDKTPNLERYKKQAEALEFVQKLMDADVPRIVIENPVSVISSKIRQTRQNCGVTPEKLMVKNQYEKILGIVLVCIQKNQKF